MPLITSSAAAAAALMATALLFSAAAAAAPNNCITSCGNVSVPYPFGIGPSHCYLPGLNLTCDTRHHPPRLLLGDGTLRVTDISTENQTVRVIRTAAGAVINTTGDITSVAWNAPLFGRGFKEHGYLLSYRNELVVSGCDVVATLLADVGDSPIAVSSCSSICLTDDESYIYNRSAGDGVVDVGTLRSNRAGACDGTTSACCLAPIAVTSRAHEVQAKWLDSAGKHILDQMNWPVNVFVAEEGWASDNMPSIPGRDLSVVPLILEWEIIMPQDDAKDVGRIICKSEHSFCGKYHAGYRCYCDSGYNGNPYVAGGCKDINECDLPKEETWCYGECFNTIGSYECRCPRGTYGYAGVKGGCIEDKVATALTGPPGDEQIGLPNCNTTCGGVRVPYPFGMSPGCCLPGFNLICNASYDPPRVFLDGNNTLQVVNIFLHNSTVRVIHETTFPDYVAFSDAGDRKVDDFIQLPDIGDPYTLSTGNEFIITGCDLRANLHGRYRNNGGTSSATDNNSIISDCVSTCSSGIVGGRGTSVVPVPTQTHHGRNCSGSDGCCHAPIYAGRTPKKVVYKFNRNTSQDGVSWDTNEVRYHAFISEEGLTDQWYAILRGTGLWAPNRMSSPLLLQWVVMQGFSAPGDNSGQCPRDVATSLCKSEKSYCRHDNGGFTCHCSTGYDGNPYIIDGCQDIDECNITAIRNLCLGGYCNNLPGHFECRCPQGTHGNAFKLNGCVSSHIGLIVGFSVASGPVLLLLVLGVMLVLRKIKHHRIKVLKIKYFKQNRGQLLQQLVSQNTYIAERMIISVDELAKATNNFDKDRELGVGGHGTVYKGILSDLRVVAIKKAKIAVQKEIDEFINEVAILSQINHKNVVKLHGCCLETEVPLLVYEFICNGTLYQHLHVEGPSSLSWSDRLQIAIEIATSLAYLHSAVSTPIIHRDIKSSNILLDDTLTAKLSDFGTSRYIPFDKTGLTTRVQGTIGYLDPMYFYTSRLTEKSDVYSFGVILMELLTRKKPFSYLSTEGDGLVAHFVNLLGEGNVLHIIDPQVIEEGGQKVQEVATLAASCVNIRGEERPTMQQVEHTLQGLRGSKKCRNQAEGQRVKESSRTYSLEKEMILSASYPR